MCDPRLARRTYQQSAVELADAHDASDGQRREDARIAQRIRDLTDDLDHLQPRCAPYDTAIATAHDDVSQAHERHRRAERAVIDSGPLGRRAARRDLANTTRRTRRRRIGARGTHLRWRAAPRPTQAAPQRTRPPPPTRLTNRRFLRLLDDHETTVADAQHTVDALDTWKHWATGHKVSLEQLVDAVDVLHSDRADHSALAAPLATWMDQHHLAPQRPSVELSGPRLERPGLEIGF